MERRGAAHAEERGGAAAGVVRRGRRGLPLKGEVDGGGGPLAATAARQRGAWVLLLLLLPMPVPVPVVLVARDGIGALAVPRAAVVALGVEGARVGRERRGHGWWGVVLRRGGWVCSCVLGSHGDGDGQPG